MKEAISHFSVISALKSESIINGKVKTRNLAEAIKSVRGMNIGFNTSKEINEMTSYLRDITNLLDSQGSKIHAKKMKMISTLEKLINPLDYTKIYEGSVLSRDKQWAKDSCKSISDNRDFE